MNYKKLLILLLLLVVFIFTIIYFYHIVKSREYGEKNNIATNDVSIYENEINQMHEEEKKQLMKELNDDTTYRYSIKESSDNTISLEYAYVTPKYTKIKLSYEIKENTDYKDLSENEKEEFMSQVMNKQMDLTIKEEQGGYPYIKTSQNKRIVPQRTSDSDGGRGIDSNTGVCIWYDTFPLTTKNVTDNFTLCFLNEEGNEVKIELNKK